MSAQLSSREKLLSIGVGTVVFLFVNYFVVGYFLTNRATLNAGFVSKTAQLRTLKTRFAEKPMWEQRDTWLAEKMPKLANDDAAGVQLLDLVKAAAQKHDVKLENTAIRVPGRRPEATAISIEVDSKSSWKSLIALLNELQQPEQFIVIEKANLKKDNVDETQMSGKFTIAKWYAPK